MFSSKNQQKLMYLLLETIFFSSLVLIAKVRPFTMELWLLPFLILATLRIAITISENEIMEWLRKPFTVTEPDSCGAGDSVNPAGVGWKRAIGGLFACPICTGPGSALVLVGLYILSHDIGMIAILVLGAAGASEFLYYAKENLSWGGRLARVRDGAIEKAQKTDQTLYNDLFEGAKEYLAQPEEIREVSR
jgi:hypothetical protein